MEPLLLVQWGVSKAGVDAVVSSGISLAKIESMMASKKAKQELRGLGLPVSDILKITRGCTATADGAKVSGGGEPEPEPESEVLPSAIAGAEFDVGPQEPQPEVAPQAGHGDFPNISTSQYAGQAHRPRGGSNRTADRPQMSDEATMDPTARALEAVGGKQTDEFLATLQLAAHTAYVVSEGYAFLSDLVGADDEDLDELVEGSQMKKPERKRLRKALSALRAAAAAAGPGATAGGIISEAVPPHSPRDAGELLSPQIATPPMEFNNLVFASLRFGPGHGAVPMARMLQSSLAERGAMLHIIDMEAGSDIDAEIFSKIERCGTFLVFGTSRYGEDTGNSASTYYEYKHAVDRKKRIILIRMIPFDEDFKELQGRVIFSANKLEICWMPGTPMPISLPEQIMMGMTGLPIEDQQAVTAVSTSAPDEKDWTEVLDDKYSEDQRRQELQAEVERWAPDGRFQLAHTLGRGTSGVVVKATDTKAKREVAIKFSYVDYVLGRSKQKKFAREALLMIKVASPNICRVYDYFPSSNPQQGVLFGTVMEFLEEDMEQVMRDQRGVPCIPIPESEVISMSEQILDALKHMHSMDTIHRDIKPGNIMRSISKIDRAYTYKLIDFSISALDEKGRATNDSSTLGTKDGSESLRKAVGTPHFMSPEQCNGSVQTAQTDLWSLGAVMFTTLTGRKPFADNVSTADTNGETIIFATVISASIDKVFAERESAVPIFHGRGVVSAMMKGIISKALQHTYDRYKDAAQMQKALSTALNFPRYWQAMEDPLKPKRVEVSKKDEPDLWGEVEEQVAQSLPDYELTRVERVQHATQWTGYRAFRDKVAQQHGHRALQEKKLFHWAPFEVIEKITNSSEGFDPRLGGGDGGGEYGQGVYFAEQAIYSVSFGSGWLSNDIDKDTDQPVPNCSINKERDANRHITVLRAQVELGLCKDFGARCRSHRGNAAAAAATPPMKGGLPDWAEGHKVKRQGAEFSRPPVLPETQATEGKQLYHSVQGTEGDLAWTKHPRLRDNGNTFGRQYVTFDTNQAYPELVLQLSRREEITAQFKEVKKEQSRGLSDSQMTRDTQLYVQPQYLQGSSEGVANVDASERVKRTLYKYETFSSTPGNRGWKLDNVWSGSAFLQLPADDKAWRDESGAARLPVDPSPKHIKQLRKQITSNMFESWHGEKEGQEKLLPPGCTWVQDSWGEPVHVDGTTDSDGWMYSYRTISGKSWRNMPGMTGSPTGSRTRRQKYQRDMVRDRMRSETNCGAWEQRLQQIDKAGCVAKYVDMRTEATGANIHTVLVWTAEHTMVRRELKLKDLPADAWHVHSAPDNAVQIDQVEFTQHASATSREQPMWIEDADPLAERCMVEGSRCNCTAFAKTTLQKAGGNMRHHCRSCGWVVCQKCRTQDDGKTTYELALAQWVSSKTHDIESMQGTGASPRRSESSSLPSPTMGSVDEHSEPEPEPQPESLEPEPAPMQAELSLELAQPEYSENVTVTFERSGELGLTFWIGSLAIESIHPGSMAAEHSDVLAPGLILIGVQQQSVKGMAMSAASARFREAGRPLTLTFRAPTEDEDAWRKSKQLSGETGLELDAKMKQVCEFCHTHLKFATASTEAKSRGWNKKIQDQGLAKAFELINSPKKHENSAAARRNELSQSALRRSVAISSEKSPRGRFRGDQ